MKTFRLTIVRWRSRKGALRHLAAAALLFAIFLGAPCGNGGSQVADDVLIAIARYEGKSATSLDDVERALVAASGRSGRPQAAIADDWLRAARTEQSTSARLETIVVNRVWEGTVDQSKAGEIATGVMCKSVEFLFDTGQRPSLDNIAQFLFDEFEEQSVPPEWANAFASDIDAMLTDLSNNAPGSFALDLAKIIYC